MLSSYTLAWDRKRKEIRPPLKFGEDGMISYALNTVERMEYFVPMSYKDAFSSRNKDDWIKAINEELDSHLKHKIDS